MDILLSSAHLAYNRTILELKYASWVALARLMDAYNRTILELKLIRGKQVAFILTSYNRTILELKYQTDVGGVLATALQSHHTGIEIKLAILSKRSLKLTIAPYWN